MPERRSVLVDADPLTFPPADVELLALPPVEPLVPLDIEPLVEPDGLLLTPPLVDGLLLIPPDELDPIVPDVLEPALPVPRLGDALGLVLEPELELAVACASRLQASKSVCVGVAANAAVHTATIASAVKSAVARVNLAMVPS
jgi:hypothetical protein